MTRSRARRSLVTALLALAACTPASEPDTTEADAQVLRGMVDQWLDAFNAGDAARLSSLYMDDAVGMPPDGPDNVGREAMRRDFDEMFEQFTYSETAPVEEVQVFGDVAFIRGTWRDLATPKMGGDAEESTGKWLWITRRQPDGQWKIARHISNGQP